MSSSWAGRRHVVSCSLPLPKRWADKRQAMPFYATLQCLTYPTATWLTFMPFHFPTPTPHTYTAQLCLPAWFCGQAGRRQAGVCPRQAERKTSEGENKPAYLPSPSSSSCGKGREGEKNKTTALRANIPPSSSLPVCMCMYEMVVCVWHAKQTVSANRHMVIW